MSKQQLFPAVPFCFAASNRTPNGVAKNRQPSQNANPAAQSIDPGANFPSVRRLLNCNKNTTGSEYV